MYCVECYLREGKGMVDAQYLFNGKSLCNIDFWKETRQPIPTEVEPTAPARELAVLKKKPSSRGTRLPEGFVPDDEWIEKMCDELGVTPGVLVREHRKFCDYWLSVAGQRGVKLDWSRTWCNWMRTAAERGQLGVAAQGQRTNDDKVQGWMDLEVGSAAAE